MNKKEKGKQSAIMPDGNGWCVGINFLCSMIYTFFKGLFVIMHLVSLGSAFHSLMILYVTVLFNKFAFGFGSTMLG